jgi:glycerophosphoryl diester phosphodiesterase
MDHPRAPSRVVAALALGVTMAISSTAGAAGPSATELTAPGRSDPLLVAHRGESARFPENTVAAFLAAVHDGAAMLELDVGLSADGAVVVLHDATLDRTTDGQGLLSDRTLAELRPLDAGSWFDAGFAAERLPTLAEVFDLVGADIVVNVEIKPEAVRSSGDDGIEAKIVALAREHDLVDRIVVSSFDPGAIVRIERLEPRIRTGVLYRHEIPFDAAALVELYGADGLHMDRRHATPQIVRSLHAAGYYLGVYTANDPDELRRLAALGVDAIFTDDVVAARAALEGEGTR